MGGGGSARREAQRARDEEKQRELRVQQGTRDVRQQFADQFNGEYYNKLKADIEANANLDLTKQYEAARRQLEAALLRNGMFDSSFGQQKLTDAGEQLEARKQDVKEMALGAEQQRRQEILDSEGAVLAQLTSTADTGAATAQAAQRIANLTPRPAFQPLGAVFQDFTAGLATQADLERQGTNRYNLGVSNWGNNVARYMRNIGGR